MPFDGSFRLWSSGFSTPWLKSTPKGGHLSTRVGLGASGANLCDEPTRFQCPRSRAAAPKLGSAELCMSLLGMPDCTSSRLLRGSTNGSDPVDSKPGTVLANDPHLRLIDLLRGRRR